VQHLPSLHLQHSLAIVRATTPSLHLQLSLAIVRATTLRSLHLQSVQQLSVRYRSASVQLRRSRSERQRTHARSLNSLSLDAASPPDV